MAINNNCCLKVTAHRNSALDKFKVTCKILIYWLLLYYVYFYIFDLINKKDYNWFNLWKNKPYEI